MNNIIEHGVDAIADQLRKASKAYYEGSPIITDQEFDELRDQLESIDPKHPFLSEVGAPISSVGWPPHHHNTLMGSLAKVKTKEEFMKWADGKGKEFLITEKYDGSTVVATYDKGELQTLATRGNGEIGENITPNAKHIQNVPQKLSKDFTGEIRGEAILNISTFEKYFRPKGYSNPRNAANGKVRDMKDDPLKQHVRVIWFDIHPIDRTILSESAKWDLIASLGLGSGGRFKGGKELIWTIFEQYRDPNNEGDSGRSLCDYEIDGMVVKVNDLDLQESFGVSSNRPKGAIAIKFPSEEKETVINEIRWNRGLTGIICPTAHLEPIQIGGVNIARASLCGIEEIQRLDVNVGDKVIVSRRNDVIPKIERVIYRSPGRPDHIPPTHCDLCNDELVRDGAYISCLNEDCQGEIYGNLMTWIKELRIKGFGPSMIRALIQEDINDVYQLYTASRKVFELAAGSEKNGQRRYEALHKSKQIRLGTFLSALNIKALGTTNGKRLEKEFKSLDKILEVTQSEVEKIPGIKTNAKKIVNGIQSNKDLITKLYNILDIQSLDSSGPLAGKSFCITGDLSLPRSEVKAWIQSLGGEVKTGVGKTLSYLVTDNPKSGTSKNKKADQYNVPKITETDLYQLAGSKPTK